MAGPARGQEGAGRGVGSRWKRSWRLCSLRFNAWESPGTVTAACTGSCCQWNLRTFPGGAWKPASQWLPTISPRRRQPPCYAHILKAFANQISYNKMNDNNHHLLRDSNTPGALQMLLIFKYVLNKKTFIFPFLLIKGACTQQLPARAPGQHETASVSIISC